jgi:hypothetical protein
LQCCGPRANGDPWRRVQHGDGAQTAASEFTSLPWNSVLHDFVRYRLVIDVAQGCVVCPIAHRLGATASDTIAVVARKYLRADQPQSGVTSIRDRVSNLS